MKIFIRADGGKSIGMGHVMRTIVLASELRKRNQVVFLCKNDTSNKYDAGIQKIKNCDFEVIEIEDKNIIENIIKIQNEHNADILISDTYEVNEEYFNKLKQYFKLTGYIDDVNKCYMNVDFIINQNINAKKLDYSKTTKEGTSLFFGPQFCMLREEFKIACKEKKSRESVEDILLTLGGMDDSNNTMKILIKLKTLRQRIHVVLGNAFNKSVINEVYKFSEEYKNIYPYENANMSELMKKCDIAISACGSTIYELCAMNVPSIGIIVADNQIEVGRVMVEEGMLSDIFSINNFKEDEFVNSIITLIENKTLRDKIQEKQKSVVDVNGAFNLVNEIKKLC